MKTKTIISSRILSTFVFICAMIVAQFAGVPLAHAAGTTDTWTGTAGDNKFSTASNWSTNLAPVTGDIIKFMPLTTGADYQTVYLTNDLTGVSLGGLVTGSSATGYITDFELDTASFAAGATLTSDISLTKTANLSFRTGAPTYGAGTVNAAGDLTVGNNFYLQRAILHVTGNLTSGTLLSPVSGSTIGGSLTSNGAADIDSNMTIGGAITLVDAATNGLTFTGGTQTIANNITTSGFNSTYILNQLAFGNCLTGIGGGAVGAQYVAVTCGTYNQATYTLTGTLTLNADLIIDVASKADVKITGPINYNGHTITLAPTSQGTLEVGSTILVTQAKTTLISDDQPTSSYEVVPKETSTLDGSRGFVSVDSGGILMGDGTMQYLNVQGIVAPGHSPGTLTVKSTLALNAGSTYQAQLQTTAPGGYDQIIVGSSADTTGNDVTIDPTALLAVSLYPGYKINTGDQFMIIKNLQPSSQAISGTFSGLPEGGKITVGGIVFSATYKGGDGNDLVLTALNTGSDPSVPNTGASLVKPANPYVLLALGITAAGVLFSLARRRHFKN